MALFNKTRGFTVIPNDILNRDDMSLKAKGLFAYLNSKPDGWNFSVKGVSKQTKDGEDSIASGMKELEKLGYLKRLPRKNDKNQFTGFDYYIYSESIIESPNGGFPDTGKAVHGISGTGKLPNHSNKELSKKDISNNKEETASGFGLFENSQIENLPQKVLSYLNSKKGLTDLQGYKLEANLKYFKKLASKYKYEDFTKVIDSKCEKWFSGKNATAKTKAWFRPSTLFGDKFENYLVEANETHYTPDNGAGSDNFVEYETTDNDLL